MKAHSPFSRIAQALPLLLPIIFASQLTARDKPERWLEVLSPHFRVIGNGSEKQARKVADQFERIRAAFQKAFPGLRVDPSAPIIVLAAKDEKTFNALTPASWKQKGQLMRTGLFLRSQEKNYVLLRLNAGDDDPYHVLYHEYTHLLMNESFPQIPLWLDEGLAEFYGNSEIQEKDVLLGKPSAGDIALLRENKLLPLTTLFAVDHSSPYYNEQTKGSIFYAESWALAHYLMLGADQEGKKPLNDFIGLLRQSVDSQTAAHRAFGDLTQLQNQLAEYVQQSRFRYAIVKGSTEMDEDEFKERELSPADAAALRGDFMIYNQRLADARTLLQEALSEDPSNAQAAESMGFLEFRQGHQAEGKKWFTLAVKLNSQSYLAHYYFAVLTMQESSQGPDATQVESSLRTATKINPNFAPAYDALGGYYGIRGERLEEARMLELQAIELEPNNVRFRVNAGNILLRMQRADDALHVGKVALSMAKTPEETAMVRTFLESAQKYQEYLASVKQFHDRSQAAQKEATEIGQNTDSVHEDNSAGSMTSDKNSPPRLQHRQEVTASTVASSTEESAPALARRDDRPHGPREEAEGKIVTVKCSPPASMDLTFASAGHTLLLHSENYFQLAYSALNFKPSEELQPCRQIQGFQARIRFYRIKGQSYVGELIAIELRK